LKAYVIKDAKSAMEAAEGMFFAAMGNPEFRRNLEAMADDKRLSARELVFGAFLMGASYALNQVSQGSVSKVGIG
jgi:hypothetical protein